MPTTVYVYGVVEASDAGVATPPGVDGCAVRAVDEDGLAALVSDLQGDTLAAAREVRAHWRVLEEVCGKATVLPVRFGTVMESDAAVRDQLLAPNAEHLRGLLAQLAGCVQLGVKGTYDEDALLRDVVTGSPPIAALRERIKTKPGAAGYYERIQLGEMVAAEIGRRRDEVAQTALAQLAPLAVQSRSEVPSAADQAFDLAFLVRRDGIDAFGRAVADVGEALSSRVTVRFVGPLPPYSFAEAELSAGSAAWA